VIVREGLLLVVVMVGGRPHIAIRRVKQGLERVGVGIGVGVVVMALVRGEGVVRVVYWVVMRVR
jgi:hypothetical protein